MAIISDINVQIIQSRCVRFVSVSMRFSNNFRFKKLKSYNKLNLHFKSIYEVLGSLDVFLILCNIIMLIFRLVSNHVGY